jgi:predicted PurR-regulated permease PerM
MADQSSTPAIVTSSVGPTMQEPVASDPKTQPSMVSAELHRPQVTFKTVVVVALAILLVGATVWVVATAHFAVTLTGLALLSAVALDHIVKRLERWKVKRWLAIIVVILCLIGVASALALLIIPAVHVNPLLVTLSVLFFGELGGILGAVAAVPLLAVVQILVGEILQLRRAGLTRSQEQDVDSELATNASNSR